MDERKQIILNTIIKEHIKTGLPVGSSILVNKYKLNISPATVRNEMADLENQGYILQPHTSAGRVPTELAYGVYLDKTLNQNKLNLTEAEKRALEKSLAKVDESSCKQAAKELVRLSDNTVYWAFSKENFYYTGLANLLKQPEFSQTGLIIDFSATVDRLDEIIAEIFNDLKYGVQILVGSKNPFGNFCSTVMAKYKGNGREGVFGILGPLRMNYEKNISLVNFVNSLINK